MKPILLKIKGLNSFVEEQVIDFDTLMEYGLFGIFGPTGSGKSTILDAITLALYGEIPRCARKGLSGIINTDAVSVYVYFEFEVGYASRKRIYNVERIVKRTRAGGTSTDTAIVCDITNENNKKVLGDQVTSTNQVLRDIIGLNASDFMKSVVLPQGSFSEFLQLDGKPRREMLERIFGLEEYGYKLSDKATAYQRRKNEQMQRLEGNLSSYEDIDRQKLDELNEHKKQLDSNVKSLQKQYDRAQNTFERYRDVWGLQQELAGIIKEYDSKMDQKDIYSAKEDRLDRANKASSIKPFIDRFENLEKTLVKTQESKLKLGEEFQRITQIVNELEQKWKIAVEQKDNVLPELMIVRGNLGRGVKLFNEIEILQNKGTQLDQQIKDIHKNLDEYNANKNQIQSGIEAISIELNNMKIEEQKYIISPTNRHNIEQGYDIEKEYHRLLDENKKLEEKKKTYEEQADKTLERLNKAIGELEGQENIMSSLQDQRKELEGKCPGDRESLLSRQNQLTKLKEEINGAELTRLDIEKINKRILELLEREQKYSQEIVLNNEIHLKQEDLLAKIEKKIEDAETQNMASMLAKDLEDGISCPVCGSKEHPMPASSMEEAQQIASLRQEQSSIRKGMSDLQSIIAANEANLRSINDQIKEERVKLDDIDDKNASANIEELKNGLTRLEDEFVKFQVDLDKWDKDFIDVNRAIEECNFLLSSCKQQEIELKTIFKGNNRDLKETRELYCENISLLDETLKGYQEIQAKTGIVDFGIRAQEIRKWDQMVDTLRQEMNKIANTIEDSKKTLDEISTSIGQQEIESARLKEQRRQMDSNITQLKTEVNQLSGGENPIRKLDEIKLQIQTINDQWKTVNEDWSQQNKLKEEIFNEYNTISENYILLQNQEKDESQVLMGMLAERGFIDRETALEYLLSYEEIQNLDQEIKDYHSSLNILKDRILGIEEKLQNESIGEEKWGFIQGEVVRLREELDTQRGEYIKVEINIEEMGKKLAQKLKLLTKKKALKKQLDHIDQLMFLLRGKKFVDFAAKSQLQYIARAASTRLKDITRGRYALELDAEGNFIIRDDFNGGARRPTHTLSGGETFVTSLSLALALSSRIQLGKSTLDFFFLDEGFGTLDAELLDVVISSLEQLRSDSMCVGLISHVEELKQRLPRRLMVSPAISGERGTLVSMD